jgi:hypothetical protein
VGTRGFIGFVADGVEKIAYNHWDSYPEGLGADVLRWLRKVAGLDLGVDTLRASVRALRVVDPSSTPTAEDIERLRPFTDLNVSSKSLDDWYCLLRGTQGDPAAMLRAGVIEDAFDFPTDSLFAEWGYVVDLDANVFEVYEGFQHSAHDKGRFAGRTDNRVSDGYYPVALVKSWPLAELPDDDSFAQSFESES